MNIEQERAALRPCPFCGGEPEIVKRDVEPQWDSWYGKKIEQFVECGCGACLFDELFHEGFYKAEEAIAAWNRCAALQSQEVQALRDALKVANDALESISNEMTVGDRWTNAGQSLLDALPVTRNALAAMEKQE